MSDDHYAILGLNAGCSQEDIKQAYRKLARLYHPDINGSPQASELMKRINIAYSTLSDVEKRKIYDYTLYANRLEPDDPDYRRYPGGPRDTQRPQSGSYGQSKRPLVFNVWGKSAVRTFAIVSLILLAAGSVFLFYPYVGGKDAPSAAADPTIGPAMHSAVTTTAHPQPSRAPLFAPLKAAVSTLPPLGTSPVPTPEPTATQITKNPIHKKSRIASLPPPVIGSSGGGTVTGRVRIANATIGSTDAYIAICNASDPDLEYYAANAGMGGYFQFMNVNDTMAKNGTPERRYVLYVWDNGSQSEAYSRPFSVEPYKIAYLEVTLPSRASRA